MAKVKRSSRGEVSPISDNGPVIKRRPQKRKGNPTKKEGIFGKWYRGSRKVSSA